jgi:hypothetical protein
MTNRREDRRWAMGLAGLLLVTPLLSPVNGASTEFAPATGEPLDAAPFGFLLRETDGKALGVRWPEPRKIRRLVVEFAEGVAVPEPRNVRVQYWHRSWDGKPDPILAEKGAGGVGWAQMDDWTNGQWKDADAQCRPDGRRLVFTFAPTGAKEFKDLGHPGVRYRKTLKVRVTADDALPRIERFQAFTDAICRPLTVRVRWGHPAARGIKEPETDDSGYLEAYNGAVLAVRPIPGSAVQVGSDMHWHGAVPPGAENGVEADLIMAEDPVNPQYDRTIITVRSQQRPFSFAADEVARGDRVLVDDLGMLVVRGDDAITLEGYRDARTEFRGKTVYSRVFEEPEQSLGHAWNDMPLKRPLYFVHGLPGNRNAMHQMPNGDIELTSNRRWFGLFRSPKDSGRKLWDGNSLTLRFGFPPDPLRGGRELRDGYLPLLRTWWQDGPVYYEQSTVLDKLDGDLSTVALDDPTVLLMRVRVVNTSASDRGTAGLVLQSFGPNAEKLSLDGDRVMAGGKDQPRVRCLLNRNGRGDATGEGDGLRWTLELAPGESHDVYVFIPSITLTKGEEIAALRERDFNAAARRICDFWRDLTAQGTQITTPEPWLNDFYKAHARHLFVNCLKEIGSDRLHAHVGTFHYGVFPNESVMMISDLDRRGYHKAAEQCLDSFLHYQGTVQFLGNYRSKDGLFYGAGGEEDGNYNKSHGYVMWAMGEHWWFTRDRAWMERAAPKLIKACDWVIRERQATMTEPNPERERAGRTGNGTRPIEYGFLPAGSLEDVTDFWYWLATNAATVWGFENVANALADYGHPDAPRLVKEAKAYRDDVMRGLTESRIRTPVVRLRDGTYVPKYPSNLHTRGRACGWVRETLEGAIFLLYYRLIPPDAPDAEWILEDYEDNLYISDGYGYSIPVFDAFWFSRGGFSMQAQLLDGPPPYLYRDEIKHYLRAYFNGFASAFYPEIRMCNEHSLPELGYPAGDHFKSSDESQSNFWLRLIFVREDGNDLYLGQAIPREWLRDGRAVGIDRAASHFGPLSFRIKPNADASEIKVTLAPPSQTPPKNIYVRIRHPESKPIKSVTVNGKPYDQFDAKKEWIVLPGTAHGVQEIVAKY